MKRDLLDKLLLWKDRPTRKPLILRGARQVGKTHLVRELARTAFEHFVEVNFEESAGLAPLFRSKDPFLIGELLADKFSTPVDAGRTRRIHVCAADVVRGGPRRRRPVRTR